MQKGLNNDGYFISIIPILTLSCLLLVFSGCGTKTEKHEKDQRDSKIKQLIESEDYPAYVKFRSFQNPDSTWGYTIFVNSRPYLHQKRIPVPRAVSGFQTKKDADKVADIVAKMIKNGDLSPKLNKKTIENLGITIKNNK
jgi:hypothetical protein